MDNRHCRYKENDDHRNIQEVFGLSEVMVMVGFDDLFGEKNAEKRAHQKNKACVEKSSIAESIDDLFCEQRSQGTGEQTRDADYSHGASQSFDRR